ncbi:unnamed protein product [Ectocarpus sp. 6 AP-2014]
MRRPSSTSSVFLLWASLQGVDAGRSSLIAGRMAASPPGAATSGATATTLCSSSGHSSRMRWSRPEARKKPRISALTPGARSLSAAQTAWATSPAAGSAATRCSNNRRRLATARAASRTTTRLPANAHARRRRQAIPSLSSADTEDPEAAAGQSLFIFGVGYVATAVALTFLRKGWTVHGTCTDPRKVKSLGDQGIKAFIFDDWSGPMMQPEPLSALASATCVLSTVPPALQSGADPVLVAHEAELQWARSKGNLRWVGYLSSTGVYGDRGGGWVTEEDEPWPAAPRTKARLKAERSWLRLHERDGLPVHVFRLAGIYGPGRSALDAVARHNGDIRLAGSDDGTMVSRTHVSDIVGVVEASIERPAPGMVLNVADDLPSTRYEARRCFALERTLAYGCKLLGFPRQDPDPAEKYVNRRGGGNKRVDNERMRALLAASGRSLTFPDYRSGLKAVQEGDGRPFTAEEPTVEPASGQDGGRSEAPSFDPANANANTAAAAGGRQEEGDVSAQLGALNAQVSRLEAKLGRVLTILEERDTSSSGGVVAAVGAAADDDGKPASDGGCVGGQSEEGVVGEASSRGETVLWEEGEALPDGVKHLAADADS